MSVKTVRIFISSPSDVRPERVISERVIARLDREFMHYFRVEAIMWEREPLVATSHFQDIDNIPPPSLTNIVVTILWSRLGTPLPEDRFQGVISGRAPVTGVEWEFENALEGHRRNGHPELLFYFKTVLPSTSLEVPEIAARNVEQKSQVDAFMHRWFHSCDSAGFTSAFHNFADATAFEEMLETHLRALLRRKLGPDGSDGSSTAIRWHQGSPFRGLLSFQLEHAPIFFGRTRARNELRELLARREQSGCSFVVVLGPSGSGKSSLVKAGLLPDVMLPGMVGRAAMCRYAVLRPGDFSGDLAKAIASAILAESALPELSTAHYSVESLTGCLSQTPAQAGALSVCPGRRRFI